MTVNVEVKDIVCNLARFAEAKVVFIGRTGAIEECSFLQLAKLVRKNQELLEWMRVPRGARVGLLAQNSLNFLAWDLAAINSGLVPVVFCEQHFSEAPVGLAERYQCAIMITDHADGIDDRVLDMNAVDLPKRPALSDVVVEDDDVLTLVFSSGTTGRMKGLRISREGTNHVLSDVATAFGLTDADRYYSFLPFSYFQQRALYFASLSLGIDTYVASAEQFLAGFNVARPTYTINPPVFYELIHKYVVTRWPTNHSEHLRATLGGQIRWMITAMAPISRSVLDFFWSAGIRLFETYAVTETGMVAWNTPHRFKVGTVGRPATDGDIRLSSQGEVLVRRAHPVSLGYFDVPQDEVEETFLSDGSVATGDIGEFDQEGFLRLIGRRKNAIVTPEGRKFHPEQVEKRLMDQFPALCAVMLGGAQLCENTLIVSPATAGVTLEPISELAERVRRLNRELPSYMRVRTLHATATVFAFGNGFRTRNLKLDRQRIGASLISNELPGSRVSL